MGTSASRVSRLEIWDDFECASGVRLGFFVPLPSSALHTREVNGEDRIRLQVYRDVDAWQYVAKERVARVVLTDGTYREFRISDVGQAHESDGRTLAELLCDGPAYELGRDLVGHVLANGEVLHDFPLPDLTPTEHMGVILGTTSGFVSGAAGWWTVGTMDFTDRVTVNYRGYTPLAAVHELRRVLSENGQRAEIEVIRVGASQYSIGLRTQLGAAATPARLRFDRNLHAIRKTEAAKDAPTRVYPWGQDQDGVRYGIGGAAWEVDSVSSNDVLLLDSPIGFDDQFNGLYAEEPDGTLIQISDTDKGAQKLVFASTPGVVAGDLVRIRKNASGHQLTYLDRPGATVVLSEPVDRPDIPGVDNLVPNPFLNLWASGLPVGFAPVGTPTIVETSGGGYVLNGTRSAQVTTTSVGYGMRTDWIPISPSSSRPHFLGQVALYPAEGVWRFEIFADDGSADGLLIPDGIGDGAKAYTDVTGQWVVRLSVQDQAINFADLGITQVQLRLIADEMDSVSGQASCYLDAMQLAQSSLPDLPFYGGWASRSLWRAGNERLTAVASGAFRLDVSITDLYRLDNAAYPHDALTLGGTVEVQDPKLGIDAETRIRKIVEELTQPGATQVELSDEPDVLVDLLTDRPPAERTPGNPPPRQPSLGYIRPRVFARASQVAGVNYLTLEASDPRGRIVEMRTKAHSGGGDFDWSDPEDGSWVPNAPYVRI